MHTYTEIRYKEGISVQDILSISTVILSLEIRMKSDRKILLIATVNFSHHSSFLLLVAVKSSFLILAFGCSSFDSILKNLSCRYLIPLGICLAGIQ